MIKFFALRIEEYFIFYKLFIINPLIISDKIDINAKRVKEWTPNKHPNAPSGTLQRTKFNNAIPGSKGYKRLPTSNEIKYLNNFNK